MSEKKPDRAEVVAALAELSVQASSPDGAVSVSVNADGVLTRLRLAEEAAGMSPAAIANAVLRTYAQAQLESAERSGELLMALGARGYVVDRLRWWMGFEPDLQSAPERPPAADVERKPNPRDAHNEYPKDRSMPGYDLVPPIPETPSPKPGDDDWYEKGFRVMGRE